MNPLYIRHSGHFSWSANDIPHEMQCMCDEHWSYQWWLFSSLLSWQREHWRQHMDTSQSLQRLPVMKYFVLMRVLIAMEVPQRQHSFMSPATWQPRQIVQNNPQQHTPISSKQSHSPEPQLFCLAGVGWDIITTWPASNCAILLHC